MSVSEGLRCPRCGGTNIRPKGFATSKKLGTVRLLRCKACSYRFRERRARVVSCSSAPPDLLEKYFGARSLRDLIQTLELKRSVGAIHHWIVNQLRSHPTWEEFLPEMVRSVKFSYVMGIDTTDIPIASKKYYYLHVVDFPNNHLAYEVMERRDAESVKTVLLKIRSLAGYEPKVVVTDRSKELLQAVKAVYPKAIVQGCLFHLKDWLDKRLPTKKISDLRRAQEWESIKSLVMRVALASDHREREEYLEKLREKLTSKSNDRKVKEVVRDFLKAVDYYHPLKELMLFGCKPEWRYNNVCERAMRNVKDLSRKMSGFKKLSLAKKYINAMWIIEIKRRTEFLSKKSDERNSEAYTHPLTLLTYGNHMDLEEAAKVHGLNVNVLRSKIKELGYVVIGNKAFARNYINDILQKVTREKPKTLQELMMLTGLDFDHSIKIAEVLNLGLVFCSPADPQRILLRYNAPVTN